MENIQLHLFSSGNLVPVCLRGVDLHSDGKNADYFLGFNLNLFDMTSFPVSPRQWSKAKWDIKNSSNIFSPLLVPVYVCTLAEKVFHEGLGNRTEVDVYPAPTASTLQWWVSKISLHESHFTSNFPRRLKVIMLSFKVQCVDLLASSSEVLNSQPKKTSSSKREEHPMVTAKNRKTVRVIIWFVCSGLL